VGVHTRNRQLKTSEKPIQRNSQVTRFRFLLPRVGLVLLASCITMMTVAQPIYGKTDAVAKNQGVVKLQGDGAKLQATLESISVSGIPKNANLIIHIHAKNTTSTDPADRCKGPILYQITDGLQSDAQGNFSLAEGDTKDFTLSDKLTAQQKQSLLKASDLDTWFLNVHDADVKGPPDPVTGDQKPISVACGPFDQDGVATLKIAAQKKAAAQANNNGGGKGGGKNKNKNKNKNKGNNGN